MRVVRGTGRGYLKKAGFTGYDGLLRRGIINDAGEKGKRCYE